LAASGFITPDGGREDLFARFCEVKAFLCAAS
jgi:cold shock CspA family protein